MAAGGTVKLADFGALGRIGGDRRAAAECIYMAPELLRKARAVAAGWENSSRARRATVCEDMELEQTRQQKGGGSGEL